MLAEGAESPEWRSVRADMQALTQACAAATAPALPTPRSVVQAKWSEEWPQWKLAIDAELQSFLDHGVWEDGGCALPAGKAALPSHIVLYRKVDGQYLAQYEAIAVAVQALLKEATTSSRAWISARPLHLCVRAACSA